jgi:hypothetical protein
MKGKEGRGGYREAEKRSRREAIDSPTQVDYGKEGKVQTFVFFEETEFDDKGQGPGKHGRRIVHFQRREAESLAPEGEVLLVGTHLEGGGREGGRGGGREGGREAGRGEGGGREGGG